MWRKEHTGKRAGKISTLCYNCNAKRNAVRHRLCRYGISEEEFDTMYTSQNGQCKICSNDIPYIGWGTNVDHDHQTGEIRGLLCPTCNVGLGSFKDDPTLLYIAAQYLEKQK